MSYNWKTLMNQIFLIKVDSGKLDCGNKAYACKISSINKLIKSVCIIGNIWNNSNLHCEIYTPDTWCWEFFYTASRLHCMEKLVEKLATVQSFSSFTNNQIWRQGLQTLSDSLQKKKLFGYMLPNNENRISKMVGTWIPKHSVPNPRVQ